MKDDKMWQLRLFQILRVRGNVFYLVDDKHTFTNILLYLNELIEQNLLQKREDQYILTDSGNTHYFKLCKELGKRGLYKYFIEAEEYKITKLDINDIYIPKKSLR